MGDPPDPSSLRARLVKFGQRPIRFKRRHMLLALLGVAAAAGVFAVRRDLHLRNTIALRIWIPTGFDHEGGLVRSRAAAEAIRPLFPRKRAPGPGDWLAVVDEPGQTFNDYLRAFTPATREAAGAILVLPFGDFDTRLTRILADVVELLGLFYGRAVQLLPAEAVPALPADQRRGKGPSEQLYTMPLLDLLKKRVPADAAALLAMTPMDLTPGPGWNFVFGQATLADRVGLWSLYRVADAGAPPERQLRRTAGVALHELGHMFGIWHCTAYECCMNGSNTMSETDACPLAFCPECDAKIMWRFHLDPAPRYRRLAAFVKARGLARDAETWTKCAEALGR